MLRGQEVTYPEDRGSVEQLCTSPPAQVRRPTRVVRIVEFMRPMRGRSQPLLARAQDGSYYVVKLRDNPQHPRILANEMFGSRLALLVGLPVPEPVFVEVPPGLIGGTPLPRAGTEGHLKPYAAGLGFGSSFAGIPGQSVVTDFLPERLLERVRNVSAILAAAFLFDRWTCNCDARQMVFTRSATGERSAYALWLIDHGSCFNGDQWSFRETPVRGIYTRPFFCRRALDPEFFEPYLCRIQGLGIGDVESCLRGIPAGWCGREPERLHELAQRLHRRRLSLRKAVHEARSAVFQPFPS